MIEGKSSSLLTRAIKLNVDVPAQLDLLARFDQRQTGPGLIWHGSNWVKESQYGLDHKTIEQNEFTEVSFFTRRGGS